MHRTPRFSPSVILFIVHLSRSPSFSCILHPPACSLFRPPHSVRALARPLPPLLSLFPFLVHLSLGYATRAANTQLLLYNTVVRPVHAHTVAAGLSWRMPRPRAVLSSFRRHEKYADVVTYD